MLATYPLSTRFPVALPRFLAPRQDERHMVAVDRVAYVLHVGSMTVNEIVASVDATTPGVLLNRQAVAVTLQRYKDIFERRDDRWSLVAR